MLISKEQATSIQYFTYWAVLVPLTFVGIVSNTLLILVWRTQVYHPTRFNLMILALVNYFYLISYHVREADFGLTGQKVADFVHATAHVYAVVCCTWMTAVHCIWTALYSVNRLALVFFTKKRMVMNLVLIFLWCLLEVILRLLLFEKVPEHKATIELSFTVLTIVLPSIVQLVYAFKMIGYARKQCKVDVVKTPDQRTHRTAGSNVVQQSRRSICFESSSEPRSSPVTKPERSTLSAFQVEHSLTRFIFVISIIPMFMCPSDLAAGVYCLLPKTDTRHNNKEPFVAYTQIARFLYVSCHFFFALAGHPAFRQRLGVKCSKWCCHKESVRENTTSTGVPLHGTTTSNTLTTTATPSYDISYSISVATDDESTTVWDSVLSCEH